MASFELSTVRSVSFVEDGNGQAEFGDSTKAVVPQHFIEDELHHTTEKQISTDPEALIHEFTCGVEEEMGWITEHLERAQSPRLLLSPAMQRCSVTSLSNVVDSHRAQHEHLIQLGRQCCDSLHAPDQFPTQADVKQELSNLDALWTQLLTVISEQKERLHELSAADDEHVKPQVMQSDSATGSGSGSQGEKTDRDWLRTHCPALIMEDMSPLHQPTSSAEMEEYCRERAEEMGLTLDAESTMTYTQLYGNYYLTRRGDVSELMHRQLMNVAADD